MSITDELREWAEKNECKSYCKLLTAIADHIDAAHERALRESYDNGYASADDWCADHEEAMAEHGWYRALCADRKPMLLGDRMEWANGTFTIHELKFTEGGCTTWDSEHGYTVHADECHHHKPNVEDVLQEFTERVCDGLHTPKALDTQAIIAEFAKKLQLAGDGE